MGELTDRGAAQLVKKTARSLTDDGLGACTQKVVRFLGYRVDLLRAPRHLRAKRRACEPLDTVYTFSLGAVTIEPAQVRSEIASLLDLLRAEPPRGILEIGTARGGTLLLFSEVATPDAVIVSVDLPGGAFGSGYGLSRLPLLRSFARQRQHLVLLRRNSHSGSTLAKVKAKLTGRPLDFLMIDGDHTYDGARADFDMYGPLVRPGGLIALHDIVPGSHDLVGGVPRLWSELRDSHETIELVEDWDQGGFGIGVVYAPDRAAWARRRSAAG
jgi:predicted O-methyltransferase YrrM